MSRGRHWGNLDCGVSGWDGGFLLLPVMEEQDFLVWVLFYFEPAHSSGEVGCNNLYPGCGLSSQSGSKSAFTTTCTVYYSTIPYTSCRLSASVTLHPNQRPPETNDMCRSRVSSTCMDHTLTPQPLVYCLLF